MTQKLSLLSCIVIYMLICSCNVSDSVIAKNGDTMPTTYPLDKEKPTSNIHGVYISKYIQKKVAENLKSKGNMVRKIDAQGDIHSNYRAINLSLDIPGVYIPKYIKNSVNENQKTRALTDVYNQNNKSIHSMNKNSMTNSFKN